MNEHESVRKLLALAAAGVLGDPDRRRVDAHTSVCDTCVQELKTWKAYADGLQELPQPVVPVHLLERTQARLAQQETARVERRENGLVLVGLALFGWIVSFAMWLLIRQTAGGVAIVWSIAWLVSISAGGMTAAVMLARRQREWRRIL